MRFGDLADLRDLSAAQQGPRLGRAQAEGLASHDFYADRFGQAGCLVETRFARTAVAGVRAVDADHHRTLATGDVKRAVGVVDDQLSSPVVAASASPSSVDRKSVV